MKKIMCGDLGGPENCEVEFRGDDPAAIVKNCQEHVMEEVEGGDSDHQDAVENMSGMSPEEQQEKYTEYLQICTDAFKRD
jgi:predicted small metal-binding protein